jgi:hypothetical protein
MALTAFQRHVCRLIAQHRVEAGERYVAGGAALNELLHADRVSRDIDLFHDTAQALEQSFDQDRALLEREGFDVLVVRQRRTFVEAEIRRAGEEVLLQWVQDSAFRFFPLAEHPDFGLTLHPFDLATNKVLALVGRAEVRDWVDAIVAHERLQPLGLLAWAAVAKDPGFSPNAIIEHAARGARYSAVEVASLAFDGTPPDAGELSRRWHAALDQARLLVSALPPEHAGECVLDANGSVLRGSSEQLQSAIEAGRIGFRPGSIRGVLPELVDPGRA